MKYLIVFAPLFLFGCDGGGLDKNGHQRQKESWETAPLTHRCTDEQMEKVHKDSEWCNNNTQYLSTYCYGSAFIRNCSMKNEEKQ